MTQKDKTASIVIDMLKKHSDRNEMMELADEMPKLYRGLERPRWNPTSNMLGDAAMALCFGVAAKQTQTQSFYSTAFKYAKAAFDGINSGGFSSVGLFGGISGMAYVFKYLSDIEDRYVKISEVFDQKVQEQLEATLKNIDKAGGEHSSVYDLIGGLTGLCNYLLLSAKYDNKSYALLRDVLDLFKFWSNIEKSLGFHTSSLNSTGYEKSTDEKYNSVSLNLGLAHGIAGPLSLLSFANNMGLTVPDDKDTASNIFRMIEKSTWSSEYGLEVPGVYFPEVTVDRVEKHITRSAWCYGNPGVARAISLAGISFGEQEWVALSGDLAVSICNKPLEALQIEAPILCHGRLGTSLILKRMSEDYSSDYLSDLCKNKSEELLETVIAEFKDDTASGYYNYSSSIDPYEDISIMDGSVGIMMALLTYYKREPQLTWEQILLI